MANLSNSDVEAILNISNLANECAVEKVFPDLLFEKMNRLFNSSSAVYYSLGNHLGDHSLWDGFGYQLEPKFVNQYQDYYNQFDPCFNGLVKKADANQALIISTHEAIDNEYSFINSEYYQDFLKPQNVHSSIIFAVGDSRGMLGLFGFQRPGNKDNYTAKDHLKARLFAAQIASSLRLRQLSDDSSRSRSIIRSLMSQASAERYLVIDKAFRLIDSTGGAAELLGVQHDRLILPDKDSRSIRKYLSAPVQDYIVRLFNGKGGLDDGPDFFYVTENKDHNFKIRIDLLYTDDQRSFIILIFLNEDSSLISEARLKKFSLTQRECEIVHQVSRGLTSMQIAKRLYISVKTVENHLSNIYEKTRTHNRTALIRLLSNQSW